VLNLPEPILHRHGRRYGGRDLQMRDFMGA
jgi:hypothetical protein